MNYQIITQLPDLERVCLQARNAQSVMLDTEFVRIRTFYPQLGLIQLFDGETLSLIDPTIFEDMTPFVELLQDTSVLKVLHACGEDLEVFQNAFGCTPFPMLDTQIMAAFLGHGLSTGFASLVNDYVGVALDKSESRTDWLARPLTQKQLDYAAADVHYLLPLFNKLMSDLDKTPWGDAIFDESQRLITKRIKDVNIDTVYLDVKAAWQLSPQQLAILKPLAAWRYKEAVKRDLALNFIFKEGDLYEVAKRSLTSFGAMEESGMDIRSVRRHGARIASIVKMAKHTPKEEWPEPVERLMDLPGYKQDFKVLKDIVKDIAQHTGLATEFLASKKQLNQYMRWVKVLDKDITKTPDVLSGWRKELFEARLEGAL